MPQIKEAEHKTTKVRIYFHNHAKPSLSESPWDRIRKCNGMGKNFCLLVASKDPISLIDRFKTLLMMHTRGHLCLVVIIVLLVSLSVVPLSAAVTDKSEPIKLISENEDPLISVNDLAFLLVTHNFDAVPKKDFVEVHLDKTVYKLVPNMGS